MALASHWMRGEGTGSAADEHDPVSRLCSELLRAELFTLQGIRKRQLHRQGPGLTERVVKLESEVSISRGRRFLRGSFATLFMVEVSDTDRNSWRPLQSPIPWTFCRVWPLLELPGVGPSRRPLVGGQQTPVSSQCTQGSPKRQSVRVATRKPRFHLSPSWILTFQSQCAQGAGHPG